MCKIDNEWCERMVKWNTRKESWSLYCTAHKSFVNEPLITQQEYWIYLTEFPELITKDSGIDWNENLKYDHKRRAYYTR
jgi:hypothetical protein